MNKRRVASVLGDIDDYQNKGYKSSISALSELIDNSIQAEASEVTVFLIYNSQNKNRISDIYIYDNGIGMNLEEMNKALVENSGTRARARRGLGKYGQGLPNSSASQTKRVELYSWQSKKEIFYNYRDLEEMKQMGDGLLPDVEKHDKVKYNFFKKSKITLSDSGTIIRWVAPNKLKPKRCRTIISHLEKELGRVFRYYINGFTNEEGKKVKCKIEIKAYDFNGVEEYSETKDLSTVVKAFDPLFLMANTQTESLVKGVEHPTSELISDPVESKLTDTIEVDGEMTEITIKLKASCVKKDVRDSQEPKAGDSQLGQEYLYRNRLGPNKKAYANISIIREHREIDSGSFGFIRDVSKPTHRWWSVEIHVPPTIDRLIGIDSKKQFASNIGFVATEDSKHEASEPLDANEKFMLDLSNMVVKYVKKAESTIGDQGKGKRSGGKGGGPIDPPLPGPTPPSPSPEPSDAVKQELYDWLKHKDYPSLKTDQDIWDAVDYASKLKDKHIFIRFPLPKTQTSALYQHKAIVGDGIDKVIVELNTNHSFFEKFVEPETDNNLAPIKLLISSLIEGEIQNPTANAAVEIYQRKFKEAFGEKLEDYIDSWHEHAK